MNNASRPIRPAKPARIACHRCNGEGRVACYWYHQGGTCFACGGSGAENNAEMNGYYRDLAEYEVAIAEWHKANPSPAMQAAAEAAGEDGDHLDHVNLFDLVAEIEAETSIVFDRVA